MRFVAATELLNGTAPLSQVSELAVELLNGTFGCNRLSLEELYGEGCALFKESIIGMVPHRLSQSTVAFDYSLEGRQHVRKCLH